MFNWVLNTSLVKLNWTLPHVLMTSWNVVWPLIKHTFDQVYYGPKFIIHVTQNSTGYRKNYFESIFWILSILQNQLFFRRTLDRDLFWRNSKNIFQHHYHNYTLHLQFLKPYQNSCQFKRPKLSLKASWGCFEKEEED